MSLGVGRGSTTDRRMVPETAGRVYCDLIGSLCQHLAIKTLGSKGWGNGGALLHGHPTQRRSRVPEVVLLCIGAEPLPKSLTQNGQRECHIPLGFTVLPHWAGNWGGFQLIACTCVKSFF